DLGACLRRCWRAARETGIRAAPTRAVEETRHFGGHALRPASGRVPAHRRPRSGRRLRVRAGRMEGCRGGERSEHTLGGPEPMANGGGGGGPAGGGAGEPAGRCREAHRGKEGGTDAPPSPGVRRTWGRPHSHRSSRHFGRHPRTSGPYATWTIRKSLALAAIA